MADDAIAPNEVVFCGVTYVPKTEENFSGDVKIVVLQRGWVCVGLWERDGDLCALKNAAMIRTWGTTKGLGELRNGPTSKTVLDKAGRVEFHILTTVLTIPCEESKWLPKLQG